jgi:hypothetical protein
MVQSLLEKTFSKKPNKQVLFTFLCFLLTPFSIFSLELGNNKFFFKRDLKIYPQKVRFVNLVSANASKRSSYLLGKVKIQFKNYCYDL